MVAPDGEVGLGHPRISAQHKHHGMGLRNQVDGQFRLGAHCVEAGCIQNHQPLAQQWVRHIDQGMAPSGHFHQPTGINQRVVRRFTVMPQPPFARLLDGDFAHLGHLGQGIGDLLGIGNIQRMLLPGIAAHAPLSKAFHRGTGFNGQQAQTGLQLGIPGQLGRAHGGAPRTGGHEAPAIVGKENGVDQLGLAAGKLGHKGHHDLVAAHLFFEPLQTLLH